MLPAPPASSPSPPLELLAPAGNQACLEAALEAGADAVYLGLTALNARRHARNFSEAELARACALVHAQGKRVHLTLNIDLAQDELTRAARMLELAARLEVDAVLVRDPALLALKPHFPELEYHLSTQNCVASRADVEAAVELGARRVVLAREMTLQEIAAASTVPGVDTEVFVQGALCFAVSGRCLLSSWVGGRSGNRGQCTGPCRVPWSADGRPGGTPFSMHDLSLVTRVEELRAAGVRSLKIEGRMKNPTWVRTAVSLLRRAMDGVTAPDELAREAERRGATPGRRLTSGYLDGKRDALTEHVPDEPDAAEEAAASPRPEAPGVRASVTALLEEVDRTVHAGRRLEPDRVRLHAEQAAAFLEHIQPRAGAILDGMDPAGLRGLVRQFPGVPLVAALPAVFFEDERAALEALVAAAVELDVPVEVNTWGGWHLARHAGARLRAGPGLGILNALAARELAQRGAQEVTASLEADALKLEALLGRTPVPCAVVVFGHPALMITRVDLPDTVTRAQLEDRRGARLRARREGGVWELRSVQPFDLRALRLPAGTAHAVVDLVGSAEPRADWERVSGTASHFNFDRVLS